MQIITSNSNRMIRPPLDKFCHFEICFSFDYQSVFLFITKLHDLNIILNVNLCDNFFA